MTKSAIETRSAIPRAISLLGRADLLLMDTIGATDASEQFLGCYVAALRGAAAVLASTECRPTRRPRSHNAWVLMARAAPQLSSWSDYFSAHSALRVAVEAGAARVVTEEFADAFYRAVGKFLGDVENIVDCDRRLGKDRAQPQPMSV